MKLRIEIDCDNAAFDNALAAQVSLLLAEIVGKLHQAPPSAVAAAKYQNLKDINGNIVGTWRLK